jgi:glucokinase
VDRPPVELGAAEIAARAVAGTDQACSRALSLYYHVAGALTQVLALAFQPFAGIYLGGETTAKNQDFIRHSSFVARLQDNELRRELLKSFPVYLVPEYMNLLGTQYLAAGMLR